MPVAKEYNVLLLGQTGVGKSTFINAFANFLQYETLEVAERNEVVCLISSSFHLNGVDVVLGDDDRNENHRNAGQSVTQACKSYTFMLKDRKQVRLIDTPGVGDTRGIEYDNKNFQNILDGVDCFTEIHAFLILLKPNETRLSILFRFCIRELLCHLHKKACKNIIFVFTHARETSYGPGESFVAVKKLLENITTQSPDITLSLDKSNVFCVDNEPFRYLVALKQQVVLPLGFQESAAKSWSRASEEFKRLFETICRLEPHNARETVTVNRTRQIVRALSKPLGDIAQNIEVNLEILREHEGKIKNCSGRIQDLAAQIQKGVPHVRLATVELDYPRTVCTSEKCRTYVDIEGSSQKTAKFNHWCHEHCYLNDVDAEMPGHPKLKNCTAMRGKDCCQHDECGCPWQAHQHVRYEVTTTLTQIDNTAQQVNIATEQDAKKALEEYLAKLEKHGDDLKTEKAVIMNAAVQFAHFTRCNSLVALNDSTSEYLKFLINIEEDKKRCGADNRRVIEALKTALDSYEMQLQILRQTPEPTDSSIREMSAEAINGLLSRLIQLPINGLTIRSAMDNIDRSRPASVFNNPVYMPAGSRNPARPLQGVQNHSQLSSSNSAGWVGKLKDKVVGFLSIE